MIDRYEIIWKAIQVHGYKYDYRTVTSVRNVHCPIVYRCKVHGLVKQTVANHLQGKECQNCYALLRKSRPVTKPLTVEDVIERCKQKGVDLSRFDFSNSKINIVDKNTRISVRCTKCGYEWTPRTSTIQKGVGCPKCAGKVPRSDEEVRGELQKLHPELDFTETKYSERDKLYRIKVLCPKHGEQLISYYNLMNGQGCYWCGREKAAEAKLKYTEEEFITEANKIHGFKYVYDENLHYRKLTDQVWIYCPTCKTYFRQTALNHLNGCGCHYCASRHRSKSESQFFDQLLGEFHDAIYQYRNKDILGKQSLDAYIPSLNTGIEFQGEQHFNPQKMMFKGKETYSTIVERDVRKIRLCQENGIRLLHYTTFQVPEDFALYPILTDFAELVKKIRGAS